MKAFRFPLERVLHWRRTQLELERAGTERLAQRRVELEASLQRLDASRIAAECAIAQAGVIASSDMQTLSAYQMRTVRERAVLVARAHALERETAAQMAKTMETQRRVKLLERLRGQKFGQWTSDVDAEQERFAAEAWLGRATNQL